MRARGAHARRIAHGLWDLEAPQTGHGTIVPDQPGAGPRAHHPTPLPIASRFRRKISIISAQSSPCAAGVPARNCSLCVATSCGKAASVPCGCEVHNQTLRASVRCGAAEMPSVLVGQAGAGSANALTVQVGVRTGPFARCHQALTESVGCTRGSRATLRCMISAGPARAGRRVGRRAAATTLDSCHSSAGTAAASLPPVAARPGATFVLLVRRASYFERNRWHGKQRGLSKHVELRAVSRVLPRHQELPQLNSQVRETPIKYGGTLKTERSCNHFGRCDSETLWMFSSQVGSVSIRLPQFSAQRNGSPRGGRNRRSTASASCVGRSDNVPGQQPSRKPEDWPPWSGTLTMTCHNRAQRIFPLNPIHLRPFPLQ